MDPNVPAGQFMPAAQRMSFVYLEHCVVHRDSNALTATDETGTVHVPAAAVGTLLLGPGTRITQQAMLLLAASASCVAWVGEGGIRFYASGTSQARSSRLLEAQAYLVSHPRRRLRVARAMYSARFPGEDVSHLTMQQLRGREGARVRAAYREHSQRTNIAWSGRRYDPTNWSAGDPVNRALSAANSCLYGAVHTVVVALGCSPGLGFVHTGHALSFVHDLADLYKAEITIPLAFDIAAEGEGDVGARARKRMRERVHEARLLERVVGDIHTLLEVDVGEALESSGLWDNRLGVLPAGVSYLPRSS